MEMEGLMENTQVATVTPNEARQTEIQGLVQRLLQIETILDGCKPLYEEKDAITLQLNELVGTGTENSIFAGGKVITVVDNFADKNTVFRPAAVKRIDVKVEDADAYAKRLKKAIKSE